MTKREFLNTLRSQLQGELSAAQIDGHIHYYEEYINEEMASGKTEKEVMEELGSPVLIAKTLLSTSDASVQQDSDTYYDNSQYDNSQKDYHENDRYFGHKIHTWNISPFVAKWVIPIVLVLILVLVLSLLGTVAMIVARFFVPILLVVLVIAIFKSHNGD
ncbi:MAG: DUF1700 domain-containing protein [Eubacteriales bacterium]|nr:DUF1700 domain-containing protein [Eubacteriales bacterium]